MRALRHLKLEKKEEEGVHYLAYHNNLNNEKFKLARIKAKEDVVLLRGDALLLRFE